MRKLERPIIKFNIITAQITGDVLLNNGDSQGWYDCLYFPSLVTKHYNIC